MSGVPSVTHRRQGLVPVQAVWAMRQSTHACASAGCFLFNGAAMAVIILWLRVQRTKEKEKELFWCGQALNCSPSFKVIRTPTPDLRASALLFE